MVYVAYVPNMSAQQQYQACCCHELSTQCTNTKEQANQRACGASAFWRQQRQHTTDGKSVEVIPLHMPRPLLHNGDPQQRMPGSYCNFLIINGAVLVPTYQNRKNDRRAIQILQEHLPKHEVIGIDCMASSKRRRSRATVAMVAVSATHSGQGREATSPATNDNAWRPRLSMPR